MNCRKLYRWIWRMYGEEFSVTYVPNRQEATTAVMWRWISIFGIWTDRLWLREMTYIIVSDQQKKILEWICTLAYVLIHVAIEKLKLTTRDADGVVVRASDLRDLVPGTDCLWPSASHLVLVATVHPADEWIPGLRRYRCNNGLRTDEPELSNPCHSLV